MSQIHTCNKWKSLEKIILPPSINSCQKVRLYLNVSYSKYCKDTSVFRIFFDMHLWTEVVPYQWLGKKTVIRKLLIMSPGFLFSACLRLQHANSSRAVNFSLYLFIDSDNSTAKSSYYRTRPNPCACKAPSPACRSSAALGPHWPRAQSRLVLIDNQPLAPVFRPPSSSSSLQRLLTICSSTQHSWAPGIHPSPWIEREPYIAVQELVAILQNQATLMC
jgi:hypothetical protein